MSNYFRETLYINDEIEGENHLSFIMFYAQFHFFCVVVHLYTAIPPRSSGSILGFSFYLHCSPVR